jgi:hypothetical protein
MAKIADLMELLETGYPAHVIRRRLKVKPYRLAQMLASRSVRNMLANQEQLVGLIGRVEACRQTARAMKVLGELLYSSHDKGETARRAASQLLRLATAGSLGPYPTAPQQPAQACLAMDESPSEAAQEDQRRSTAVI